MPQTLLRSPRLDLPMPLRVELLQPLSWLALAWRDICRAPWLSLAHGLALALFGALILLVGHNRFWLMAGALSGFLVIGPAVATSLYAISRALERGEAVDFGLVRRTWMHWQRGSSKRSNDYWCLVQFGLLLAISATGWVVVSASLITLFSPVRIASPMDFVQHVVLASDSTLFYAWLSLGSFLAAPIFASSVISMPFLLDRKVSLSQAVCTSWLVILQNPIAMALWAALIVVFTLLGLASLLLGLVFVMPMLGHASWHAYRDLVDASDFELREAAP